MLITNYRAIYLGDYPFIILDITVYPEWTIIEVWMPPIIAGHITLIKKFLENSLQYFCAPFVPDVKVYIELHVA